MDKIALVTGASSGLGRQLAIDLSNNDYKVYVTGRNLKELIKTCQLMNSDNLYNYMAVDLTVGSQIEKLCESIKPDILINCAGIFLNNLIENTNIEMFDRCFAINVKAPFILMRNFIPHMKRKKWGRIINIGSSSAYAGFSGTSIYCATKHALLGLSRSAFNEYKDSNVRVISVSPGSIKTPMGLKVKNQDYKTFIEPKDASRFIIDLLGYDGNMICEEVRINRMFVQ